MKKINELIKLPEVRTIFDLFNNQGIYLVGGCIRDTLSGKEVTDIDFAVDIDPEEVVKILTNNNIKFYDIGINYGTVTAVIDSKNVEITSLREDIETDGRHAKVKYTSDIKADSLRRDFTINAIYANRDGELFDFHNGLEDIENRRLKFIGSASDRVKEDYLRILRYFRFYADFSNFDIDADLKKVFKEGSQNLSKISKERIWTELKKIINHNNSFKSLSMMNEANILTEISDDISVTKDYLKISHIENKINKPINNLLKLSILLESSEHNANNFIEQFPISNEEADNLRTFTNLDLSIKSYLSIKESRAKLYRLGVEKFQDFVILNWIKDSNQKNDLNWHTLHEVAKNFEQPKFSFGANDIIRMGIEEGPLVGKILSELEEWWIDSDFIDDEYSIFERLKAICLSYK
ncbi:MAG: CCA tRNA nucleotidyltransferase [Pelagibacterales bacterium]|nr:CCA tRNA nucleotidyltransferase [Pelagibacterales bacterium]